MKNDKILARLDSMMTRIGSSLIGVNTENSDFDFATSISVWSKIRPILVDKLGFKENPKYDYYSSGCNKYSTNIMHNNFSVKMEYDGNQYDFIIYDDNHIAKVQEAVRKFKDFLDDVPNIIPLLNDRVLRVEIFQHFLQHEFKTDNKTDDDLLDDCFAGI